MIDSATPASYSDVLERLERDGVRYVVVGGIAVVLHGHVRPVADLDIVVSPAPDERRRAHDSLTAAGFTPGQPAASDTATDERLTDAAGRVVVVHSQFHAPFEEIWDRSERRELGSRVVRVVSLEQLLRAKWASGRPHDVQDITALLELKATGAV